MEIKKINIVYVNSEVKILKIKIDSTNFSISCYRRSNKWINWKHVCGIYIDKKEYMSKNQKRIPIRDPEHFLNQLFLNFTITTSINLKAIIWLKSTEKRKT